MEETESDEQRLAYAQRLNAATHYTVGKICEQVGQRNDMEFSRQFIAVLSEATSKYSQTMTQDAEMFAKHARRTTIQLDDVKLLVRKSPSLLNYLQESYNELGINAKENAAGAKKPRKPKKKKTDSAADGAEIMEIE